MNVLPCPFCGSNAKLAVVAPLMNRINQPKTCRCSNRECCASHVMHDIDLWNKRVNTPHKED